MTTTPSAPATSIDDVLRGGTVRSEPNPSSAATRTTATSASAMPATAHGPIRSPSSRPPSTGSAAADTAVTGATTLMTPPASAR